MSFHSSLLFWRHVSVNYVKILALLFGRISELQFESIPLQTFEFIDEALHTFAKAKNADPGFAPGYRGKETVPDTGEIPIRRMAVLTINDVYHARLITFGSVYPREDQGRRFSLEEDVGAGVHSSQV